MGRSVSTPSNAIATYGTFEGDQFDWDDLVEDFQSRLSCLFPSVSEDEQWIGRENHVLASNRFALFGVSEYCGLVSYWVVPRDDFDWYEDLSGLANNWVDQIAPTFQSSFGDMVKTGHMSNGQGVYVAKASADEPAEDLAGDRGHVVVNGMLCG